MASISLKLRQFLTHYLSSLDWISPKKHISYADKIITPDRENTNLAGKKYSIPNTKENVQLVYSIKCILFSKICIFAAPLHPPPCFTWSTDLWVTSMPSLQIIYNLLSCQFIAGDSSSFPLVWYKYLKHTWWSPIYHSKIKYGKYLKNWILISKVIQFLLKYHYNVLIGL